MNDQRSLVGQWVWITGASSGIGAALARAFAAQGARLVLSSRRAEALERVRQTLEEPTRHRVEVLDVADPMAIRTVTDRVLSELGTVAVLVCNSGLTQRSAVFETRPEVERHLMEVNFFGATGMARALLPAMRRAGGGTLVVTSSLVGELPVPMRAAYCASKHALQGWFEALRAEEHEHNIRVLMVMPGFVHTQVSVNALRGDGTPHGQMDARQRRGVSAEECARRVLGAVQQGREQVIIGGREVAGLYLKRWFPALYRRLIRRFNRP